MKKKNKNTLARFLSCLIFVYALLPVVWERDRIGMKSCEARGTFEEEAGGLREVSVDDLALKAEIGGEGDPLLQFTFSFSVTESEVLLADYRVTFSGNDWSEDDSSGKRFVSGSFCLKERLAGDSRRVRINIESPLFWVKAKKGVPLVGGKYLWVKFSNETLRNSLNGILNDYGIHIKTLKPEYRVASD